MNLLSQKRNVILSNQKGLSLIEILIALTLLGLAATFITGRVLDSLTEGQIQAAKIQMSALSDRLKEFKRHCNFYPTQEQGLEALVSKPTSGRDCKRYAPNGYLEDGTGVPLDPWDNDYIYTSDGRTFNIISLGADGLEGGEGADADISLREQDNNSGVN